MVCNSVADKCLKIMNSCLCFDVFTHFRYTSKYTRPFLCVRDSIKKQQQKNINIK